MGRPARRPSAQHFRSSLKRRNFHHDQGNHGLPVPVRSRGRRDHRERVSPRAAQHRADRLGEHRLPRRYAGDGHLPDQQVRRGLSRQALLRRLLLRRRDRGDRPSARLQALRRRARERPAPLRREREPRSLQGDAPARRHLHGHEPRPRRPSVPRQPGQHLRSVFPSGPLLPQR